MPFSRLSRKEPTVEILVGPDKVSFIIGKELLCKDSDFFRAALEGSFKEAQEGRVELPDTSPEIFAPYHHLLIHHSLPPELVVSVQRAEYVDPNACWRCGEDKFYCYCYKAYGGPPLEDDRSETEISNEDAEADAEDFERPDSASAWMILTHMYLFGEKHHFRATPQDNIIDQIIDRKDYASRKDGSPRTQGYARDVPSEVLRVVLRHTVPGSKLRELFIDFYVLARWGHRPFEASWEEGECDGKLLMEMCRAMTDWRECEYGMGRVAVPWHSKQYYSVKGP